MTRPADWPERLDHIVTEWRAREFFWGECDCGLFCADWIKYAGGPDLKALYFGPYRARLSAAKVCRRSGFRGIKDMMSAHLKEIPPLKAKRGDIALYSPFSVAVVIGRDSVSPGWLGMTRRAGSEAASAFEV